MCEAAFFICLHFHDICERILCSKLLLECVECKTPAALALVSCTQICGTAKAAVPRFNRFVSRSLATQSSPCGICGEPSGTGAVLFSLVSTIPLIQCITDDIQSDSGGKVNVLGGDFVNMCLFLICYRERERGSEREFESPSPTQGFFFRFVLLDEKRKFTKQRWVHQTNCSPAFWMLLLA